MRTTDPALMLQGLLGHLNNGLYQAAQHQGVYIGIVTDTHSNNPQVPQKTIRFTIPQFGAESGWVAAPFPGLVDPPLGTECVVAFEGTFGNAPRVLAFTNWQAPVVTVSDTDPSLTYTPTKGDLWIKP